MIKKLIALFLVAIMSINMSFYAFAATGSSNCYEIQENGITKSVVTVGQNKILLWDDGNNVIAEQYNNNQLVGRSVGNRSTSKVKSITMNGKTETTSTTSASDVIVKNGETSKSYDASKSSSSSSSATYVGKVSAISIEQQKTNTMKIYETLSNKTQTTYTIKRVNMNVANFIVSVVTGLGVEASLGSGIIAALLAAGAAVVVGKVIEVLTSITLASLRYDCSYYGKDVATNKQSKTYKNCGKRYTINSTDNKKYQGKVFYTGQSYNSSSFDESFAVAHLLVQNLYGVDFEAYEY